MAITSIAAVEAEYTSRQQQIATYPAASLDQDVARLRALATAIDEAVGLLRAREALHGRAFSNPALEEAANAIRAAESSIRQAVATAQAQLPV